MLENIYPDNIPSISDAFSVCNDAYTGHCPSVIKALW